MYRSELASLKTWVSQTKRKPIMLRGARQVGKSTLIRQLGADFGNLVEINLEKRPDLAAPLLDPSPAQRLKRLEALLETKIIPGQTLLFLDEVQATPPIIPQLRYLYEDHPDLHVIAAGSLLDFVLSEAEFSMPVGRIDYLHLGPMCFEDFLRALGRTSLLDWVLNYQVAQDGTLPLIPPEVHTELMAAVRSYLLVGGMPESVLVHSQNPSLHESEKTLESLLQTFREDFNKYRKRTPEERLRKTFDRIPFLVGKKLKYSQIDPDERARDLKVTVKMLTLAKLVYLVRHSSASGIPLGAQADEHHFKSLFLDVGLMGRSTGLRFVDFEKNPDLLALNRGALAEQFIGQHLLYSSPPYIAPELYYWEREKKTSQAEVDYLIVEKGIVVPVEVKAGGSGRMRSLALFLKEKKSPLGLRFYSGQPSLERKLHPVLSLPFYLVGQARRLTNQLLQSIPS
jgi:predicted AAA+ superfamily ATPase